MVINSIMCAPISTNQSRLPVQTAPSRLNSGSLAASRLSAARTSPLTPSLTPQPPCLLGNTQFTAPYGGPPPEFPPPRPRQPIRFGFHVFQGRAVGLRVSGAFLFRPLPAACGIPSRGVGTLPKSWRRRPRRPPPAALPSQQSIAADWRKLRCSDTFHSQRQWHCALLRPASIRSPWRQG
jgi:hypothetical protein